MDNITQGVVGGLISETFLKKYKLGNKPLIIGALVANIPDLDVFIARLLPISGLDQEFFHRGIMHSIFFNILLAPILGYIFYLIFRKKVPRRVRSVTIFVSILSHLLIDTMTSYGTMLLLPFSATPISRNNIFIVDIFLTPLMFLLFLTLFFTKNTLRNIFFSLCSGFTLLYFGRSFLAQRIASNEFSSQLTTQNISYTNLTTFAEPIQTLLRRGLAETKTGYYQGYYSLLDAKNRKISFTFIPKNNELLDTIRQFPNVQKILVRHNNQMTFSTGDTIDGSGNAISINMSPVSFGGLLGRENQNSVSLRSYSINTSNGELLGNSWGGRTINKEIWNKFWKRVWGL